MQQFKAEINLVEVKEPKKVFDEQTPEGVLPLEKFFQAYKLGLEKLDPSPLREAYEAGLFIAAQMRATHEFETYYTNFTNYDELRQFIKLSEDEINRQFKDKNEPEQNEVIRKLELNNPHRNKFFEEKAKEAVLQIFNERFGKISAQKRFAGFQTNAEELEDRSQGAVVNFRQASKAQ